MEALIQALDLSALPELEQQKVRMLLQKHKAVFSAHEGDLGCTDLIQHEIPLLDNVPIRQRYRRIPPSDYEAVKSHIHQLLEANVIRESCSPYASPIVIVRKKDGSLRLCVDYRQLNSRIRRDSFPLPRIEESLDALCGARWFSTMDLASGYNQVPVAEADRMKTAFCTPFGLFEFNRMPFGLCNAPSTFQRLMERMFGAQHFETLLLYLDDIIVFSASVDQHLERLDSVLARLRREGLKVKLEKCCFFQAEVRYLGHVISKDGVSTDPDKVAAVAMWAPPQTVAELRSFLGFASYYRRFVKGFAKVAAPLHRLVAEVGKGSQGRRTPLRGAWSEACSQSFEELKSRLVSAPVLAYADFSRPFILEVDASLSGLGAVLSQEKDGRVTPIAYASRSLSRSERKMPNYSSMKLEFLALKWAMADKFREYLLGHKCVVWTDNNPLSHLRTAKLGATEQRWAAQLEVFDYSIKYRSGRVNRNADALSRQHPPDSAPATIAGTPLPVMLQRSIELVCPAPVVQSAVSALPVPSGLDLTALQKADPAIDTFANFWRRGTRPSRLEHQALARPVLDLLRQWERIVEHDSVLHRRVCRSDGGEDILQVLLPATLRDEVLQQLHQGHGHQGVERTTELIRARCYWPRMYEDIKEWCRRCERCTLTRSDSSGKAPMGHLVAAKPNQVLAIDFTVLEMARDGKEHVLVMTDVFSKFTQAVPTSDQRAPTVAGILVREWFYKFGIPARIHSDQGRNFESALVHQLCQLYGITKTHTTPYHPQGNAQCERFNRTLHGLLCALPAPSKAEWPRHLPQVLICYNTTIHQTTGESPYLLMFGQEPNLPVDFLLGRVPVQTAGTVSDWLLEHSGRLQVAFDGARDRIELAARLRKERHDQKISDNPLAESQLVYLRNTSVRGRNKIQDAWGPIKYVVLKAPVPGGCVYSIAPQDQQTAVRHVHRSMLKAVWPPAMAGPLAPAPSSQRVSLQECPEEESGHWVAVQRPSAGVPQSPPEGEVAPEPLPPEGMDRGDVSEPRDLELDVPSDPGQQDLSSGEPSPVEGVRRSTRETAGKHSNIHHLPRPVMGLGQTEDLS